MRSKYFENGYFANALAWRYVENILAMKSLRRYTLPPERPPTLREAICLVASFGGFLGRKGDGEPGTKSLFDDIATR